MQVRNIPISDIAPSPLNPRKTFEVDELIELAASIKENGLVQPITVRKTPKGSATKYEIVCGERRYRACVMNEMETIEAVVKDLDNDQAFICMVLENLQRRDVDPIEEAAISYLYDNGNGHKVAKIAKAIGKSETYVVDRVFLNNIIPDFAALLRNKTLGLVHLLKICRLTKAQQTELYKACFTPECIERWPQKVLRLDTLSALINEHVMNALSTARFSTNDGTYMTCGACEGCKLNTATHPKRFEDTDNPRCMKRELFLAKNIEALVRRAKNIGLPAIYIGTEEDNEAILAQCKEQGLEVLPLGNREYVQPPREPQEESFTDKGYYAKRLSNYQAKKATFDDNIKDGTIVSVFELCYAGTLSGEIRYVYNVPVDEKGNSTAQSLVSARSIDSLKRSLYESTEKEQADITEAQRAILADSAYGQVDGELSQNELGVFAALILKRLGHQFRQSIGIDFQTSLDTEKVKAIASNNLVKIAREYIKTVLSEESVGYSADLAKLLDSVVSTSMVEANNINIEAIHETYEKKREELKNNIETIQKEMHSEE